MPHTASPSPSTGLLDSTFPTARRGPYHSALKNFPSAAAAVGRETRPRTRLARSEPPSRYTRRRFLALPRRVRPPKQPRLNLVREGLLEPLPVKLPQVPTNNHAISTLVLPFCCLRWDRRGPTDAGRGEPELSNGEAGGVQVDNPLLNAEMQLKTKQHNVLNGLTRTPSRRNTAGQGPS